MERRRSSREGVADRRRMLEMGVPPVQLHRMRSVSGLECHEVCADRIRSDALPGAVLLVILSEGVVAD